MSTAEDSFRAGDLAQAVKQLQEQVRKAPADPKLRIFLAQLSMVQARWERALDQLQLLEQMDASALPMVRTYQTAIQCERLREAVFAGQRAPIVFGDPQPWLAALLQALQLLAQGHVAQAAQLRTQALEEAPASPGSINGSEFAWIADADSRLGPVLEVFLQGGYYWVPFSRISKIVIEPPADVRDLVWVPAQLTVATGAELPVLIPSRYPDSASGDPALAMSRRTEWRDLGEETYIGTGQRVLSTDTVEVGLFELRELTIAPATP